MADSATLKIERAVNHISDLQRLFEERKPFSYVLETNIATGERSLFSKQDRAVVDTAAVICGDVVHNLRSALDHVYWAIVAPFAKTDREKKKIQFPFCKEAARLEDTARDRLADRVSKEFFQAIIDLKPFGEAGGNEFLYLIDELNIPDKHKMLIPTGDYRQLSSDVLRRQVPDFPDIQLFNVGLSNVTKDIVWRTPPRDLRGYDLGEVRPPTLNMYERKLAVPVDILFSLGPQRERQPVVPTLRRLIEVARESIAIIRKSTA